MDGLGGCRVAKTQPLCPSPTCGRRIFVRTHARAGSISTPGILETILPARLLARSFIVCNVADDDFKGGGYRRAFAGTRWANRLISGPPGAHAVAYFIDRVCELEQRYVRFDDNVVGIDLYDVRLKSFRSPSRAEFARFLTPSRRALGGATHWGCSLGSAPKHFADSCSRQKPQDSMLVTQALVCGGFAGFVSSHDGARFARHQITDDIETSCRAVAADGCIARYVFLVCRKRHKGASFRVGDGGIAGQYASRDKHVRAREQGVDFVVRHFPGIVRRKKQGEHCGSDTGLLWGSRRFRPLTTRPLKHLKTRAATPAERQRVARGRRLLKPMKRGRPSVGKRAMSGAERKCFWREAHR